MSKSQMTTFFYNQYKVSIKLGAADSGLAVNILVENT